MANKVLYLKLSYKGKLLDIIRQGADFDHKWFIGSDRRVFWHVLDDSGTFPAKHQLLARKGTGLYLRLPEGSNLSCSKDNKPVDAAFLHQNGVLEGTELKLRNDMSGTVQLHPNYTVEYEYSEPVVSVLGLQEQAIVADVSQTPPLSSTERTNRGLILLFLILGLAFILVYDLVLKPQTDKERSLSEMLAEMERAQRIVPQVGEPEAQSQIEPLPEETQPPAETQGQPAARPSQGTNARAGQQRSAQAVYGNLRGGTGGGNQTAYKATVLNEFVTARPGSRGGSGGGSTGGGDSFTPSAGAGYAGTFDPSATADYTQTELGRVVTGKTPSGGTTVKPNMAVESFTGDASKLRQLAPENVPIAQTPQIERIKRSFQTQEVATLSEASIAGSASGRVTDIDNIYEQLTNRKNQIKQSYIRNSAVKASSGSITVVMYIDSDGSVVADITPNSPTFTQSFLQEVKTIVENWRFNVSKKTRYQFQMRLSQS